MPKFTTTIPLPFNTGVFARTLNRLTSEVDYNLIEGTCTITYEAKDLWEARDAQERYRNALTSAVSHYAPQVFPKPAGAIEELPDYISALITSEDRLTDDTEELDREERKSQFGPDTLNPQDLFRRTTNRVHAAGTFNIPSEGIPVQDPEMARRIAASLTLNGTIPAADAIAVLTQLGIVTGRVNTKPSWH